MRSKFLPSLAILAMMLSMTGVACASVPDKGPAFSIEDISIPHSGYKVGCTFTPDGAQKKPASEASSKPELLKPEAEQVPSGEAQEVPTRSQEHPMKPVDQTILHGEGPRPGDCFRASIASLLELPTEAVPHFMESEAWFLDLIAWLGERDLSPVLVEVDPDKPYPYFGETHMVISGTSPRDDGNGALKHSCVGYGDWCGVEVVHDPHPSRAGLARIDELMFLARRLA